MWKQDAVLCMVVGLRVCTSYIVSFIQQPTALHGCVATHLELCTISVKISSLYMFCVGNCTWPLIVLICVLKLFPYLLSHTLFTTHYAFTSCGKAITVHIYACTFVSFGSIHFRLQLAVVSKRTIISVLRNPHAYIMQVQRELTHTHQFTACMVV